MPHKEHATQPRPGRSIRFKINLVISQVFLVVVALLTGYSYVADRQNNLRLAIDQARGMNAFYFGSLNTLMLTDGIDDRAILRDKMLEMPGIVDVISIAEQTKLLALNAATETITTMSRQIAVAADEHSKVSGDISRSVSTINEAAAGTAADSELVATASRELTQIAQHLDSLVGQFRTG